LHFWYSPLFLLFAYLTGKGTELIAVFFLTLIVAITVGQATYNIVKEQSLNSFKSFCRHFVCLWHGNLRLNI
jgi:hypothetical protein